MTRKRMYDAIRQQLIDQGLPCNSECRGVVDVAVDGALDYVLRYAVSISEELVRNMAYSEAMVAGMFVNKIKGLKGDGQT